MKITRSKAGEMRYEESIDRTWRISDTGNPDVFQSALFAWEQMYAYGTEDDEADELTVTAPFTLSFCGFITTDFPTMDAAKEAAPEFARLVLLKMIEMI
jgi:hypothetical protein